MQGGGSDLWATRDSFHLSYTLRTGDVDVIAKIERLSAPVGSNFAMAAITMRESLASDARHASIVVSTEGKAKFRRRVTVGGSTSSDGPPTGSISIPRWVRLTRRGNDVTAYLSADGVTWHRVHTTQRIVMPARLYVGIVALRNGASGTARADFSHLTVK